MCLRHLFISPGHNFFGHHEQPPSQHPVLERDELECVAGRGISGDRFFGYTENYKGQITFFAWEVFEQLRRELGLPDAHPSGTRRNVITEGMDLNALVGREFEIQGIRFAGVEECRPCYWMNNAFRHEQAESWLKGNGGLRARILNDGILRVTVAAGILPAVEPGFQPGGKIAANGTVLVKSERHATSTILSGRQAGRPAATFRTRSAPQRRQGRMNFSAVILAGGKSSRMGRDKAWLPLDSQTLLARQIELVRGLAPADIFISGRADTDYSSLGCPVLTDEFADAGPLAGIAAGLKAASAPLMLVLAVDMPDMTSAALHRLLERCAAEMGVVPRVNHRVEPLAAFYPKAAATIAVDLLKRQLRAVRTFAEECKQAGLVTLHDADEADWKCFANWNSPADLPLPGQ